MSPEKVIPKRREVETHVTIAELIQQAQESDTADRQLTISQALNKYKKAIFWAMFLSTSLIMEGYDLNIVRHYLL
jgi:SP family general alpha glucoside:H+ symporter-like MFS transporter